MSDKKGKCLECGVPLSMPESIGYCPPCAEDVFEAQRKEFPFEVVDRNGMTLEGFRTEREAEDYAYAMRGARAIKSRP